MENKDNWEVLEEVSGAPQAELLRGLLEAQGIMVVLSQEGLSHSVFSLTVGPLATVQVLVPSSQVEQARIVLDRYYAGDFEEDAPDQTIEEEDFTSKGDDT